MWPTIGTKYLSMFQEATICKALLLGITLRLIILFHQRSGHNFFNNWGSISIFNISYKLFAKAL